MKSYNGYFVVQKEVVNMGLKTFLVNKMSNALVKSNCHKLRQLEKLTVL